ncbi:MAG TPA: hypothetical protein VFD57_08105 [Clostridia bacterium]|nr:hypothetical protein [Clostridia bacterium]
MPQLKINSRRLYETSDPLSTLGHLDRIASEYVDGGWEVRRGFLGIVILPLQDGEVHYIPTGDGIEEIIFEGRADNE